ncbi:hypothetical protein EJ06DRAFT_531480 [Trichodelitschia bisporula]|uniref:RAD52 homolog n=1 Tax=Trichodelitschia bisporula TaxID=703511 RepID=A0A6G1HSX3_9PEZI|nr:hypothetical protein EJ06DRAFT_531480 [Trichodelitschia bisporula]
MPSTEDLKRMAGDIHNPFIPPIPRMSEYTAEEIATLQAKLDRQLGPEFISSRKGPGGKSFHYVAAEKVIGIANEVFGFNGWSSAIQNVTIDYVDIDKSGKVSMGCSTIVRVTLKDGTYHEDIGYGETSNMPGKGQAFEKIKKEASTDALKRALRSFGNVLGNCIYDKDYVSKVSRMKTLPAKWDEDNLHRHPDFIPPKQSLPIEEASMKAGLEPPIPAGVAEKAVTEPSSNPTSETVEYEDEYGSDFLDLETNNSDTAALDALLAPPQLQPQNQSRQQLPRIQSLPQLRQEAQSPNQFAGRQHPQQPQQSANGQTNANPRSNAAGQMPPPQYTPQQYRPQGQRNLQPPQQHNPNQQSRTVSMPEGTKGNQTPQTPQTPRPSIVAGAGPTTANVAIGFVAGRAAELVQKSDVLPANVPTFNPHAESPSLRRTAGVHGGKSVPITRSALGTAANPGNPPSGPSGPAGATTSNRPNPNFVNPQSDTNRRIGLPGGGVQSPMGNRTAYRPPTIGVKRGPEMQQNRAPLADVSNATTNDGGGGGAGTGPDAKRLKTDF